MRRFSNISKTIELIKLIQKYKFSSIKKMDESGIILGIWKKHETIQSEVIISFLANKDFKNYL